MIPYTVCLERYRFYRISIGFYLVPLTEFSIYAGLFANIMDHYGGWRLSL